MNFDYDVIVVGAGHAGCEAARASALLGASTLLVTADLERVAQMSCNPAVGGIAKGQIVREIDALGGMTGIVADSTAIQFRMLNLSKGPAVWSPRVQSDRTKFSAMWRRILDNTKGLSLFQDLVEELVFDGENNVSGIRTRLGFEFGAEKIIITAGTFLNGMMHFGRNQIEGGRISEPSAKGLSKQLERAGLRVARMKTGTPPRVSADSIDFSLCQEQPGESLPPHHKFSFLPEAHSNLRRRSCHITHTNPEVHKVLRDNLADSPLYNGQIKSIGPRYCPSIETKIVTFADKDSHQLFLEPEGETTSEYYINGFSSSLPWTIQLEALQKIPALRNVHFLRPGYAIEYDFFDPLQLNHDLSSKVIGNLYLAGQVNGTTGYEEAAAQGLVAGINASRNIKNLQPLVLRRDQAYIGVLIDDLVTKGVDEPYRMFTSRAEYRILLRQDDADMRLTPVGREIGLVDESRYDRMLRKKDLRDALIKLAEKTKIKPMESINAWLEERGTTPVSVGMRLVEFVRRPQLSLASLREICDKLDEFIISMPDDLAEEVVEAAEIQIKYAGYISRERMVAERNLRLENLKLPDSIDYNSINSISTEARQKLAAQRPLNIGQASRIPGVSPSDISILTLLIHG